MGFQKKNTWSWRLSDRSTLWIITDCIIIGIQRKTKWPTRMPFCCMRTHPIGISKSPSKQKRDSLLVTCYCGRQSTYHEPRLQMGEICTSPRHFFEGKEVQNANNKNKNVTSFLGRPTFDCRQGITSSQNVQGPVCETATGRSLAGKSFIHTY
jgi:hypothetical protein